MNDFFKSFNTYYSEAQFGSISFWAFPVFTFIFIWFLTTVGMKIFTKRRKLKMIFVVNRAWIISSLIVSGIVISLICFWWSENYFAKNPLQLSMLLSLIIAMVIPILSLLNLRGYYTQEGIKEIIDQPKTLNQLDTSITFAKGVYRNSKLYYIIPLFGFLFLLLYLNKGTNLISLIYDNSGSMNNTTAIDAVSETFENLQMNNEITLTTLEGFDEPDDPQGKISIKDLMLVSKSSALKGGNTVSFQNPLEAIQGLSQTSNSCFGSPICEAIWKNYLFIKETKANRSYKNKVLIVITDGMDNIDESLKSGNFFFDNEGFEEFFPAENVFIIDYSQGISSAFMQRSQTAGCDVYPAENNKQDYLDALDNALQSFKNNWNLIYWTISIFLLFSVIGVLIKPTKIV